MNIEAVKETISERIKQADERVNEIDKHGKTSKYDKVMRMERHLLRVRRELHEEILDTIEEIKNVRVDLKGEELWETISDTLSYKLGIIDGIDMALSML